MTQQGRVSLAALQILITTLITTLEVVCMAALNKLLQTVQQGSAFKPVLMDGMASTRPEDAL